MGQDRDRRPEWDYQAEIGKQGRVTRWGASWAAWQGVRKLNRLGLSRENKELNPSLITWFPGQLLLPLLILT